MKPNFLLLLLAATLNIILLNIAANAQPFAIGKTSITFTDAARNGRSIPTDIYYPAQQAGTNTSVVAGTQKFPVISIGHGFVMSVDAYANLWNMLVPEGYIVALPRTETSLAPSHENFGKDLAFVIDAITLLNQNSSSLFFNRIDSMNCVMGHSMGGGAAHLAAAGSNNIKSVATLAAAETNPSAIAAAGNTTIPALVFAGANDCVTPPANHQLPIYNALKSACKTYISINGASHCQMAESNFNCNFGESTCSPGPAISRADQHAVIKSYLIPWLNYQLKKDCNQARIFDNLMKTDTKITYLNQCSFCLINNTSSNSLAAGINIYPNPFSHSLTISGKMNTQIPAYLRIESIDGKVYISKYITTSELNTPSFQVNTTSLPPGFYILRLINKKEQNTFKIYKAQ